MKTFWQSLTVLLSMVMVFRAAQAFDIAAYFDARSRTNYLTQYCQGENRQNRPAYLANIGHASEQQVMTWLSEMGVTQLVVYYPHPDD